MARPPMACDPLLVSTASLGREFLPLTCWPQELTVELKARQAKALPIDEMDALLAATALASDSTLATRNTSHFQSCGIRVLNPWL